MRTRWGSVLLGAGSLLLITTLLLRAYVYPHLAFAPRDPDDLVTVQAPGATLLDLTTGRVQVTGLTTTVTTHGDPDAGRGAGSRVRVWRVRATTTSSSGARVADMTDRIAFDAETGAAVTCCAQFYSGDDDIGTDEPEPVLHRGQLGLLGRFPLRTARTTYPLWEPTVLEPVPARYVATTQLFGTTTYEFRQVVDPTLLGSVLVSRAVVGLPGTGRVWAGREYAVDRTVWVEPRTGVVVSRHDDVTWTLSVPGAPPVTLAHWDAAYDDRTVHELSDQLRTRSRLLALTYSTLPVWFLSLGLLLVLCGGYQVRRMVV